METPAANFYHSYVREYHEVRAIYLNSLLSNLDTTNDILKDNELRYNGIEVPLTNNTEFIIRADLRQNYFHAIETFFEFFFAFIPQKGRIPDNSKIVRQIAKSNWRRNNKQIEEIAKGKMKLNFITNKIEVMGYSVSIGHYLFFPGTFSKEKFDKKYQDSVETSVKSIMEAIKIMAVDFCDREEYNAYKHTMRVFPYYDSIQLINPETMKEELGFDISNSASFQVYNDKENETIVKTKLFDSERDFEMAKFCSRLIYNMIELRNAMFNQNEKGKNNKEIPILLFNKSKISEITKHNVEIQDLTFSTRRD